VGCLWQSISAQLPFLNFCLKISFRFKTSGNQIQANPLRDKRGGDKADKGQQGLHSKAHQKPVPLWRSHGRRRNIGIVGITCQTE
jgi:hypothetical protein